MHFAAPLRSPALGSPCAPYPAFFCKNAGRTPRRFVRPRICRPGFICSVIPLCFTGLFYYGKQHFEALACMNRVRMPRRHNNALSHGKLIGRFINNNAAAAVKTGQKCISSGGVRTYFLPLVKGKKSKAHVFVLGKSAAYNLPLLVLYKLA